MATLTFRRHERHRAALGNATTYDDLLVAARVAARQTDYNAAAFCAGRAAQTPGLERHQRFAAHMLAADLYRRAQNYETARAHLNSAHRDSQTAADTASIAIILADIHRDCGKLADAKRTVNACLAKLGRAEAHPRALLAIKLGQLALIAGDRHTAIAELTPAHHRLANDRNLGDAYIALKWLIMAERPHRRLIWGWLGLQLAARHLRWWHGAEIIAIAIGGQPLYRRLHPTE